MEKFSVQLRGKDYEIEPHDNGTYRIFHGEDKIGVIYPAAEAEYIAWKTMDELEQDFVSHIGELISAYGRNL